MRASITRSPGRRLPAWKPLFAMLLVLLAGTSASCFLFPTESTECNANRPCGNNQACDLMTFTCQPTGADLGLSQDLAAGGPSSGLSLVAGALGGPGYADGTGPAARFSGSSGIVSDNAGNLYIGDSYAIRKLVLATGVVTTLAGVAGSQGFMDGTGSAARFGFIEGMAWDGLGDLLVADSSSSTIRLVTVATGTVTTIAGAGPGAADGTGFAAHFNYPRGVAWDGAGNLYVADSSNNTIRKVVVATGTVTTIAGSAGIQGSTDGVGPAARFNYPQGIAWDGAGNLYVADSFNNTIRKVLVSTGAVTTFAGKTNQPGSQDGTGAVARFNQPFGLAWDGAGNLYVADSGNNTVRKVMTVVGVVTTIAGGPGMGTTDGTGPAARFNYTRGVAVDSGNLYVTDSGNGTLRKIVVATGAVTTLAGTPPMQGAADATGNAARFAAPTSVVADGAGNLYVADSNNNTIRKVVLATGAVTTLAGEAGMTGSVDGTGSSARFSNPSAMVADGAGNLYVSDTYNFTIRQVVLASGAVTTIAGSPNMFGSTDATGSNARFYYPQGMALDGAGNLYVVDNNNSTIRKVVLATGDVSTLAGQAGAVGSSDGTGASALFRYPTDVTADGAGNLYVADTNNDTIRQIVLATGAVTTIAGTALLQGSGDGIGPAARFSRPRGVAADRAGNLYIADIGNGTIRKLQLASNSVTTLAGVAGLHRVQLGMLPAELNSPAAVTPLPNGMLIVLDENSVLSIR